jgi:hypothetical protein
MGGREFHGECRRLCWGMGEDHIGGFITDEMINTCANYNF